MFSRIISYNLDWPDKNNVKTVLMCSMFQQAAQLGHMQAH